MGHALCVRRQVAWHPVRPGTAVARGERRALVRGTDLSQQNAIQLCSFLCKLFCHTRGLRTVRVARVFPIRSFGWSVCEKITSRICCVGSHCFVSLADVRYQLLSMDGCNTTTRKLPCEAGGELVMWRSPALRGPTAQWQKVGSVFSAKDAVLAGAHLTKEFVTVRARCRRRC